MRREVKFGFGLLAVFAPLAAAGAGILLASGILHPQRKPLTLEHGKQADEMQQRTGAAREDFEVTAPDGAKLRGWEFRATKPNGDWVLAFHGVSDNRMGMLGQAELLLRHGYNVIAMDARAHGASDGERATFGWLERNDTRAIADALFATEQVHHLFAVGSSYGASVALQSAGVEPRIQGVVAESAFADLREVSFDYAGLRMSHWLGRTLFRPASFMAMSGAAKEGGFNADDVSPEKAVAARAFPVLLICGTKDNNVPPRHTERIYKAATGPKEMWLVPGAGHAAALGTAPEEYERRVLKFFSTIHSGGGEKQAGNSDLRPLNL